MKQTTKLFLSLAVAGGLASLSAAKPAAAAKPAGGPTLTELIAQSLTIADIKQRDRIIIGSAMKFRTFVYKNASTRQYEGFMVDVAKALAKKMLGDESKIEWRYAAGTDLGNLKELRDGGVDVMIDAVASQERKKKLVNFTDEIFHSGSALMVKKDSSIQSYRDFKPGTRVLYFVLNQDFEALKKLAPEATYIEFQDPRDALAALKAGEGDVYTHAVTHLYSAASQNPDYTVVGRFTDRSFSIVSRHDDAGFNIYLNDFVQSLRASGDYERLYQKWFAAYGDTQTFAGVERTAQASVQAAPVAGRSATLENIRQRDMLVVGTAAKFYSLNIKNPATGQHEGFMVDIAKALAKRLLGDENKLEWRDINGPNNVGHVARGDVDFIIDAVGREPQKTSVTAYSDEIFHSGSGLLVKKTSPIKYVGDLDNSTRIIFSNTNLDVKYLKEELPAATYLGYETSDLEFEALKAGKGDVMTATVTHLYNLAYQHPDYTVVGRYTDRSYSIICKKDDPGALACVNDFVRELKASGEHERLFQKWFGSLGGNVAR